MLSHHITHATCIGVENPFLTMQYLYVAAEERPHVVVREDWPGDERGDLPLRVGDVVILLSDAGNGWYEGRSEPGVCLCRVGACA